MRQIRNPQQMFGEIRIEEIRLDAKSRDDIPALLIGLQHLYSDAKFRERLFALLDQYIFPGTSRKTGRPGMEMWRILVMGVIKQGLGCDFDRLHELVNQHQTLRQFLGHPKAWDEYQYELQTIVDNVSLMSPELLAEVNQLIVESGHAVAEASLARPWPGALIPSSPRPMSITPPMSVSSGTPCAASSVRPAGPPSPPVFRAGASGSISAAG